MSAMERIAEAAQRLIESADEHEFLHALAELRDEIAADANATAYTNLLIGGYQP